MPAKLRHNTWPADRFETQFLARGESDVRSIFELLSKPCQLVNVPRSFGSGQRTRMFLKGRVRFLRIVFPIERTAQDSALVANYPDAHPVCDSDVVDAVNTQEHSRFRTLARTFS